MRQHRHQVETSVEASVARFPKFVRIRGSTFTNFGKLRTAIFDSRAAYDFEVPVRNRGTLWRNFKIGGTGTTRLRRPLARTFVFSHDKCPSHPASNGS